MKFIHTADFHLSKTLRLEDFQNSLNQIRDYAIENNVDFVVVAGDIFHRRTPDNEARTVFNSWLSDLFKKEIHVIVLTGTHDMQLQLHSLFPLKRLELKFLHILDQLKSYYIAPLGIDVLAIPHFLKLDISEVQKALIAFDGMEKHSLKLIVGHVPIIGARVGQRLVSEDFEELVLPVSWFQDLCSVDYIALGHIHQYQKILDNMYYSGSIERVNFGEKDNTPCFLLVDVTSSSRVVKRVELNVRPMVDLHISDDKYEQEIEKYEPGTLVRVVISESNVLDTISFRRLRKLIEKKRLIFSGVIKKGQNFTQQSTISSDMIVKGNWVDYVLQEIEQAPSRYDKNLLKNLFTSLYRGD